VNNLKQMGIGSMLYAQDFNGNLTMNSWVPKYINTGGANSDRSAADDDLNWLYPTYVKALGSFTCPSTHNTIRNTPWIPSANAPNGQYLDDLTDNAVNTQVNRDSYEVFGLIGTYKKTEKFLATYEVKNYTGAMGTRPGASAVFLIMDADDTSSDPASAPGNKTNNWPEDGNNHGAAGTQANFCDGHAEWIPRLKFARIWNLGQDSNFVPPP
jgi:hypothetical protein